MVVDDLFRLEVLTDVSISPNGKSIAYVIQRSPSLGSNLGWPFYLEGNERADVWLASSGGRTATRNLTNGAAEGAGFWHPVWSPDGQWLAMLSTRGGNIGLWVWSKQTDTLQRVSDRPLNPRLEKNAFLWTSDRGLLFWVTPTGTRAFAIGADTLTPETAGREWAKARGGKQSTASVLVSGVQSPVDPTHQSQLLLKDVQTGDLRLIDTTPWVGEFSFATLRLSPDHHHLAFLKQIGTWAPRSGHVMNEIISPSFELTIADLGALPQIHSLTEVHEPFWGSIVWAPDGSALAVTGYLNPTELNEEVFRCGVQEGRCRAATNVPIRFGLHARNMVDSPPYLWLGSAILILGENGTSESRAPEQGPRWWLADEVGQVRLFLKSSNASPPDQLVSLENGFLGVLRGHVWRINTLGVPIEDLTTNLRQEVTAMDPTEPDAVARDGTIVLRAHHKGQDNFFLLDARRHTVEPLPKPATDADLVAYDAEHRTCVFATVDASGTFLWTKVPDAGGFKLLLETNQFLRDIEEGQLERIEYQSLDGAGLNGWIILPVGYRQGKRYPVVTWVYAGETYGSEPPDREYLDAINNPHPLNLQLLAAHGYVVFMPSMPLPKYGTLRDPYMELTKGVLPGLAKLVEIGIADPERLGVMGQSTGGFSVYGLITQTNRFKVAVALAGFSDLVSFYGTFDARWRYQSNAAGDPFRMWDLETRGMGGPPWEDLQRYVRNSPISYVDRVHTPVLIIHGDLDPVPIEQDEEFFTALYRQNKRAVFVRYWGEDHLLTSPANIRDMWERIYAWFDNLGAAP